MKKKYSLFGVNYNSVNQKLRILAIIAIFYPKNPFLTDSINDTSTPPLTQFFGPWENRVKGKPC